MIADINKVLEMYSSEELTEDTSPSSCDVIYVDFSMCQERRFQPMFRVRFDKPVPILQMYTHILRRDGTQAIESMPVTSWPIEDDNNSECRWSGQDLHSPLVLSERILERFLPRYCHSGMNCNLCRMESNKSKNSFSKTKGIFVKKADTPKSRQYKCLYNQNENIRQRKKVTYPTTTKDYTKVKIKRPGIKRKPDDKTPVWKDPEFWKCRSYDEK